MKPETKPIVLLVSLTLFVFIACTNKTKKDESEKTNETKADTTTASIPGFDPAMDATKITGYPARVLADSLDLRAYEFLANPGDSIPLHAHPDHLIYVLEGGTAEIKDKDGTAQVAEFKKDACMILGATAHSAKNTGKTPLKLLIVHVYRPRS